MPSTYTGSGLELIGDGEQSGSWGVTTNTNLQIINRLVSEAGTISLSGTTHTLTLSDGTLSDGQYAVLVFGGAPSGTNMVTISPNDAKRVFIVSNTSGQSVVLTQGSGGNVTIANGDKAVVYSDGGGASAAVVDVTPLKATLAAIGSLTPTDGTFIVGNGSTWVAESGNTVLQSIGVTATTAELNIMDGVTATTAELNFTNGVTSNIQTQLNVKAAITTSISAGTGLTGGGTLEANRTISHADTSAQASVDNAGTTVIQDVTLDGFGHVTALGSKALGLTDFGVTATSAELNVLDGITATTAELNYTDGVTSSIQTQLNNKQPLDAELTAIAALATTDGNIIVGNGSTWVAESGATARTSLGLGSIATQNSNAVTITGGSISGITDIAVADGGTGASTAANARTNLGVVIGTNVQAWDVNLDQIAALPPTDGNFIVGNGSTWVAESGNTVLQSIGVTATATELNVLDGITATTSGLNTAATHYVPSGGIILWSGSIAGVPSGWFLCNGSNGTPDLRDRFVVGAGSSYAVDATGGAASVTLTTSQIPSHAHTGTTDSNGAHTHDVTLYDAPYFTPVYRTGDTFNIGNGTQNTVTTASAGAHTHSFTTATTGDGTGHENRPPYYALAYIMKA
jgi:microcystin-dependent protein